MGGTSANAPGNPANGGYLGPYTQHLVNAALNYVAPPNPQLGQGGYAGLSATPPSYAQAANTAAQMINTLPMQTGKFLLAPKPFNQNSPVVQPRPIQSSNGRVPSDTVENPGFRGRGY